ncbi:HTH-type transcriptional regulator YofA [compost metagenome]
MIDLRSLQTFHAVALLGGFHKAAEKLHTSQPAVSARIAQLEQQLKGRLFERDKRGCYLTTQGRELLNYAERMLALETEMVEAVAGRKGLSGTVSLGASDTIVHTWLSDLLKLLNQEYPEITLDVVVDSTANMTAGLTDCTLDIALLMGPVNAGNAENLPLCSYPISWIKSPDLEITSDPPSLLELAAYPIITFARNTRPYWQLKEMFAREGVHKARLFSNSSLSSIVRMAVDGIGIAAIPEHVVLEEIVSGKLHVIETPYEMPVMSFTASFTERADMPLNRIVAQLAQKVAAAYWRV